MIVTPSNYFKWHNSANNQMQIRCFFFFFFYQQSLITDFELLQIQAWIHSQCNPQWRQSFRSSQKVFDRSPTFHRSFEENLAAPTCHHSVVAPRRLVSANQAHFGCGGRLSEWRAGDRGQTHTHRARERDKGQWINKEFSRVNTSSRAVCPFWPPKVTTLVTFIALQSDDGRGRTTTTDQLIGRNNACQSASGALCTLDDKKLQDNRKSQVVSHTVFSDFKQYWTMETLH